ncbi:hypothetical protein BgAZ_402650 [Babesia gibsoni]|uniref:Uncharacterized protein n=1 Tax=Babesia gibsoni TaxID=33632 RepID=A0AAD8LGK8_BABGI|nr:hypothetical protein BgAZ_402650 [Babesia gibsoni]
MLAIEDIVSGCEKRKRAIVVHYSRYWLPSPDSGDYESWKNLDRGRIAEIVLEPQVLWLCFLRKIANLKIVMFGDVYDTFVGGPMPAAYVDDEECFKGEPLRQDNLMQYLVLHLGDISAEQKRLLNSDFILYKPTEKDDKIAIVTGDDYENHISILPLYVEKHLRYAVLYLIWVYPIISKNVTRSVVINSMPWPHGHIAYYMRANEIGRLCAQCGYSNIEFTIKELSMMLRELQRALQSKVRPFNNRPGYWMEGSIFANLAVLFSIPCHGVEELLALHREFYDLKSYCINVNSTYNVVKLQPPFLCGNQFPISYFVEQPCSARAALDCAWERFKQSHMFSLFFQQTEEYNF